MWDGKSPPDYNGNFFLILKKKQLILVWNPILYFFVIHSINCTFISFLYNFPLLPPKLLILILFCLVVLAALATEFHYSAVLYSKGGFIEQKLFSKLNFWITKRKLIRGQVDDNNPGVTGSRGAGDDAEKWFISSS